MAPSRFRLRHRRFRHMRSQQTHSAGEAPVQFLIVAAPRTGSTHLRLLLNSHPSVCCHGEVFRDFRIELGSFVGLAPHTPSPLRDRLAAARHADPGEFLMRDVLYPGRMSAVGAKILYGDFAVERWAGLRERVLAERQVRVVHLMRRNRLKRFLSQYVVERVTKTTLALSTRQVPSVGRIRVPVPELLADVAAVEAEERRFRDVFSGHRLVEIHYEDVASPPTSLDALDGLQQFLGVEPTTLASPTQKILSERIEDVIENVAEVEAALLDTPHAWMLGDESAADGSSGRRRAAA
jgi:hypothetical protein